MARLETRGRHGARMAWRAEAAEMFERFNEAARMALFHARCESAVRNGASIDCQDLLEGVLIADAAAVNRLAPTGAGTLHARRNQQEVERELMAESSPFRAHLHREIPLDQASNRALERTIREADDLGHDAIRPEHLVLGLLQADRTEAWQRLHDAGMTLGNARRFLREHPRDDDADPGGMAQP